MQQDNSRAKKQCLDGFCGKFPTVWLKNKPDDMKKERDKQCKENFCSKKAIEVSCRKKWLLKVDFEEADITKKCFDEGKVKECFDEKKTKAGEEQIKCDEDGTETCGTDADKCEEKSKADNTFKEAKEACAERKKMC